MNTFLTLDLRGLVLAFLLGASVLIAGGRLGLFFLALLLLFLFLSAIVTMIGKSTKKKIKVYEERRGWKNVVANGFVPFILAILYYLSGGNGVLGMAIVIAYVSSICAVTADKFSSELGVLFGKPIMLLTMRKVKPGVSGGVTFAGLVFGFIGSLFIGICTFYVSQSIVSYIIDICIIIQIY